MTWVDQHRDAAAALAARDTRENRGRVSDVETAGASEVLDLLRWAVRHQLPALKQVLAEVVAEAVAAAVRPVRDDVTEIAEELARVVGRGGDDE